MSTQPASSGVRSSAPKRTLRRRWFVLAGLALGFALALYVHVQTNFHAVVPGIVYRGGQLVPGTLECYIQRYHFRTVVNLRGTNPDSPWYQDEVKVTQRCNVRMVDLATDSKDPPNPNEIRQIMEIVGDPQARPVLLHCFWGVERTAAMAAVCVLLLEESDALAKARAQFKWSAANFPWLKGTRNNLAFIDRYEKWLVANRLPHSPAHFRNWALGIAYKMP